MFTVKHITRSEEFLFSATRLWMNTLVCSADGPQLNYQTPEGSDGFLIGGFVQVLNSDGVPVADYALGLRSRNGGEN